MTHISQYYSTNPGGLLPLQKWQIDFTKMTEFDHLKYICVTVDTFSYAVVVSAFAGEEAWDAIDHFCHAFSILGVALHTKPDGGPAYVS